VTYLDVQYRFVQYDINGFDDNPTLIQHNTYHFVNPKLGINWQPESAQPFLPVVCSGT